MVEVWEILRVKENGGRLVKFIFGNKYFRKTDFDHYTTVSQISGEKKLNDYHQVSNTFRERLLGRQGAKRMEIINGVC